MTVPAALLAVTMRRRRKKREGAEREKAGGGKGKEKREKDRKEKAVEWGLGWWGCRLHAVTASVGFPAGLSHV